METRRLQPAPPQTQARSSTTFRPPKLDGSQTLPELLDWHLKHTPDHRLFVYEKSDGSIRNIKWPEAVRAIHTGSNIVRDRLERDGAGDGSPVVAILAHSDTIPYYTAIMSIIRANCVAFPISPRNSSLAVAHLIHKAGVRHVLVGREPAVQELIREALELLTIRYDSTAYPTLSAMLVFEELYLSPDDPQYGREPPEFVFKGSDAPAVILHSSGSTAFPKPITWTQHRLCQLGLIPWFGDRDLTGTVFALHTMPMYHGMGVLMLCWTVFVGMIVGAFEPKSPVPIPTADALFVAAKATESDIIFCVPSMIEAWARKPEYVAWLATRGGVLFGGGPLNKEAGDYMVSQGVTVFILYGATEGGIMSLVLPAEVDQDWEYFRFSGLITPHMVPYGNGTFEFIMVENAFCRPSVLNTQVNGTEAYATSDLVLPHPTKPGYWRVFGRTDDQIMHNTGEKTNPGPLESMLNQDSHVLASVMFGRGRFQAGILVDPKPEYKFDPSDETKLAGFRNMIWPTVERMNAYAPQHSRLFKEMIIVAKPSKPFAYTAKSTARRQATLDDYAEEIDAVYNKVEESAQLSIPPPTHWDILSTLDFVRAVVKKIVLHDVSDDDNLFQHGCDSLQATYIRNSLLRALRYSAQLDTRKSVGNFVYDHPSIRTLASFLLDMASGRDFGAGTPPKARIEAMLAMVAKYSADFRTRPATRIQPARDGAVVLVTGTTGSLGCYILDRLVKDRAVTRIYALNRPSGNALSLLARQRDALKDRGIDVGVLTNGKVVLLEADTATPGFSVDPKLYAEMQSSVTHVIHNAWRVDFNLSLESFETNVKGLRNLVDFAISSHCSEPPRLLFTSSIGVFENVGLYAPEPLREEFIEAGVALSSGYPESKWVSERILQEVAENTGLDILVVRVGQISGGPDGAWNVHEWFPSMVQSAIKLGCFPDDSKMVSWIPIDTAASVLVELLNKPSWQQKVIHLIHPRPFPWASLARVISKELSVPLVTYPEWLSRLEALKNQADNGDTDARAEVGLLRTVRALRLLPWFKGRATSGPGGDAMGFPTLAVTQAVQLSPVLANAGSLTAGDVERWLAFWKKMGMF